MGRRRTRSPDSLPPYVYLGKAGIEVREWSGKHLRSRRIGVKLSPGEEFSTDPIPWYCSDLLRAYIASQRFLELAAFTSETPMVDALLFVIVLNLILWALGAILGALLGR